MKIIKRKWGFYSVLDKQGRELSVHDSYKSAVKWIRKNGGR